MEGAKGGLGELERVNMYVNPAQYVIQVELFFF